MRNWYGRMIPYETCVESYLDEEVSSEDALTRVFTRLWIFFDGIGSSIVGSETLGVYSGGMVVGASGPPPHASLAAGERSPPTSSRPHRAPYPSLSLSRHEITGPNEDLAKMTDIVENCHVKPGLTA